MKEKTESKNLFAAGMLSLAFNLQCFTECFSTDYAYLKEALNWNFAGWTVLLQGTVFPQLVLGGHDTQLVQNSLKVGLIKTTTQ